MGVCGGVCGDVSGCVCGCVCGCVRVCLYVETWKTVVECESYHGGAGSRKHVCVYHFLRRLICSALCDLREFAANVYAFLQVVGVEILGGKVLRGDFLRVCDEHFSVFACVCSMEIGFDFCIPFQRFGHTLSVRVRRMSQRFCCVFMEIVIGKVSKSTRNKVDGSVHDFLRTLPACLAQACTKCGREPTLYEFAANVSAFLQIYFNGNRG